MPASTDRVSSGIQVIDRVVSILQALSHHPGGMSFGQIAEATDLPRATVQRITVALIRHGFVLSHGKNAGLVIGPEVLKLAREAFFDIIGRCRPVVDELCRATGETVDLSLYRNAQMIFLDQRQGIHKLQAVSAVGEVYPMVTTANGRAVLMNMPRSEAAEIARTEIIARGLDVDVDEFMLTLGKYRQCGLAYAQDGHTVGISAAGFSFRDGNGERIAISMPIPTSRYKEHLPQVEQALYTAKAAIIATYPDASAETEDSSQGW